jgi:hypothetical protein
MLRISTVYEKLLRLNIWKHAFTKKQVNSFVLLAMITATVVTFTNSFLLPVARATYVEGFITQNTVWTLVDSPFVVSQNVTVSSNATLTIEPGVEVRFGGDFSLIISGRLLANGTQDSLITFTSNKYQPGAGDWGTIEFNGTQPSLLAYCSITYATNGITAEHSNVEVKNSVISYSVQYGISIVNSTALIQDDEITSNLVSGIYASGNVTNSVAILNNTISSNVNGILLDGTNSSGVNISNNIVLSNNQSGIQLNADAYKNLIILYNNILANGMGFFISGQANQTYITNNSISYNNIGFLYAGGQDHEAHWNDIYSNVVGMGVSASATTTMIVNATYNYWGDSSGPYHVSLNPAGKGNPVKGNGWNLIFIFFLTEPISYVNQRPTARLWADKTIVPLNQPVTFIGTLSSDDGRVDKYFFDFGDGQNSGWTTLSIFVHNYTSTGYYTATLKVMDDFGAISNMATVGITCVEGLAPLTVSLIPSSSAIGSGEQLSVSALLTSATSAVANASVTFYPTGGDMTSSSGLTNSTGYFTTTFLAPNVAQTTNIRMTVSGSMAGYWDSSDYKYLTIVPILSVQLTANPESIMTEKSSNATAYVTSNGTPVSGATVNMSSTNGSFAQGTGVTNDQGICTLNFTAPLTETPLIVNITATATESGYIPSQGQTSLTIEPKWLLVQVDVAPTVTSEMASNVTVKVTYNSKPISGATVVLSSNMGGSFVPANGTTNATGLCKFTFTAPQVMTPSNVTITTTASEAGYAENVTQTRLTVKLATLTVEIASSSAEVESGKTQKITVYVTSNSEPVANAVVTVSSGLGGTLPTTNSTDQNGDCEFVFTAPKTTSQYGVFITANASKNGYTSGQSQTAMTVNPAVAGPSLTILLMIIVVIIVAIVLVLIKLKILVISSKGE